MTQTVSNLVFTQVLILDADPILNRMILEKLAQRSSRGTVAATLRTARRMLNHCAWNLIFFNPSLAEDNGQKQGTDLLTAIRRDFPEVPIVMLSNQDSSEQAIRAIRAGCVEFLVKPLQTDALEQIFDRYLPNHEARVFTSVTEGPLPAQPIVGQSRTLGQVLEAVYRAAPSSAPILLCGESGTGKELLAHLIHARSRRAEGPFIRVNCAALNESLLESELVGHEKGAFTGAIFSHQGRFERAHGGTLLLDEITETPPAFQAKLLRVLEQMSFERVGGCESVQVNVRVLSTTNQDIIHQVREGMFRADLFYRLAGIRLTVPALRQRMEDLSELIWFFVNQYAPEVHRQIRGIERETLDLFENYTWPGNIRQLRNVIRTALILGTGPLLSVTEIPWLIEELTETRSDDRLDLQSELAGCSLDEVERHAILATLDQAQGNQSKAAKVLGISDRTLRERIRKYRQERLLPTG